jgi:hypothetical protein
MLIALPSQRGLSSVGATCGETNSFHWLKNVAPIVSDVVPLQKFDVFLVERFPAVMLFLATNIADHCIQMRMRNRKRAKSFLP